MAKITIVIEGNPIPWRAAVVTKKGTFSPRHKQKKQFCSQIQSQYQGDLLTVPVIVDMFFFMPIPKSTSKKNTSLMINGDLRPAKTPDRTNLAKLYEDCLQGIVIKNDSQIVGGMVGKFYSPHPRTVIYIEGI